MHLPQGDIERHHETESDGERNDTDIGMLALRHLGDQILNDDIEHGARPFGADCSIAGTIRLQIEAATITPAANPESARCIPSRNSFCKKNTQAEPAQVPTNGISSPVMIVFISVISVFLSVSILRPAL